MPPPGKVVESSGNMPRRWDMGIIWTVLAVIGLIVVLQYIL